MHNIEKTCCKGKNLFGIFDAHFLTQTTVWPGVNDDTIVVLVSYRFTPLCLTMTYNIFITSP